MQPACMSLKAVLTSASGINTVGSIFKPLYGHPGSPSFRRPGMAIRQAGSCFRLVEAPTPKCAKAPGGEERAPARGHWRHSAEMRYSVAAFRALGKLWAPDYPGIGGTRG